MTNALLYAVGGVAIVAGIVVRDVPLVMGGCAYWCALSVHRLWDAWRETYR